MLIRDRLRHVLRPEPRERFFALRDVSFSVERGESLAVVGQNGAGKSTLLNLATRVCMPSEGTVRINGRVAALLELGAGFHGDLTGTENVRINAALLGLTRQQVNQRFDSIVEFSGVGDFMDEPLRTFSSGMRMRLAFSVAVNVDPDILIIDEILGVGDQDFFAKCFERIMEFRRAGKTLLCVSHALESLEILCDHALWLDHGRVSRTGPVRQVLRAYAES
jgi:ABC-type polysaccharide/polyol phosphate transport system ATPase subunit